MSALAAERPGFGLRARRERRRTAMALLAGIGLNLALLAVLLLTDRPAALWIVSASPEAPVRLELSAARRPPVPVPASQATAPRLPPPHVPPPRPRTARPPPSSLPAATQPAAPTPGPAAPVTLAPTAPDAGDQARTAAALRALSACSHLGAGGGAGGDSEDRAACIRQLAAHREERIDTVPAGMRAQQTAADARRAYVESGQAANLLPQDKMTARDHGVNMSIHYQCTMKFGAGIDAKMHCPGVN